MPKKRFHRILLKISGEALAQPGGYGLDEAVLKTLGKALAGAAATGTQIAIVIGAGNILRGRDAVAVNIERSAADTMAMLATVMNAIALQNVIEQADVPCRVQSALAMPQVAEPYIRRRAIRHLEKGRIVIFGAGTGNPYFTTDTAAAQRALEMEADVLLKGTKVDGIYDADPVANTAANRYTKVSYDEVIHKRLGVMDATAFTMCRENNMPIIVFDLLAPGSLGRVLTGETVGTEVGA